MDKRPVIFLDSGSGCLPYGSFFHLRNKKEKLVCVADRANFPYGPKSKELLISVVSSLVSSLIDRYNPKLIAIACNTATVSALSFLREKYPEIPFVGTVPAVKPAVLFSKKRKVGVLGTERTIDDPYIARLAARYADDCEISGVAAPALVEFAERRYALASGGERLLAVKPWIEKLKEFGADAAVLGCTHFLLLKDEFLAAAGEEIRIYDSLEGVCKRAESILAAAPSNKEEAGSGPVAEPVLAVTGDVPLEDYWNTLASCFGFRIGQI